MRAYTNKKYPVARKRHECNICGQAIGAGTEHKHVTGFYKSEGEFNSVDVRICPDCLAPADPEENPHPSDMVRWAEYHGATVIRKDSSYYVDCWRVPECHISVSTGGDDYTLSYVGGYGPDLEKFARWLDGREDLPELPEPWRPLLGGSDNDN